MKINPKVVDISHYDNVHPGGFVELKKAGYLGVINKATQGFGMIDKTFALRRPAAAEAGLLYGAYHYLTKGNVADQVEHFLEVVGITDGIELALDHEDKDVDLDSARAFCEQIHAAVGRWPLLYSGFLIKQQIYVKKKDPFWAQIRLWLSHYSANPKWPPTWDKPWLWQFTGDGKGPKPHEVPGITIDGGMDINSWDGTDDELVAQWAKGQIDGTEPRTS